jgi:hypothetical protein
LRRHSILDTFLARQYSEGDRDSEGVFTLSADRALKKIGESALPFESAWVLKVIQAAVAAEFDGIQVNLLRNCIEIEFTGSCRWLPDEISYLLQVVDAGSTLGLEHLVAALRDRLAEDCRLLFLFAGQSSALYWTGEELQQRPLEEPAEKTILAVQTGSSSYGTDLASMSIMGAQNALVAQTIADNAFLCPIPLFVDSRRVDRLSRVIRNDTRYGVPVASGWLEQSTYQLGQSTDHPDLNLDPRGDTRNFRMQEPLPEALCIYIRHLAEIEQELKGTPWVVRAHFHSEDILQDEQRVRVWRSAEAPSTIDFVKDGILVDQYPLFEAPEHVSLHIFLNARGLQTDLTGFALVENQEREVAVQCARELAKNLLKEMKNLNLPDDSAFPTTSWGDWILRFVMGTVEQERLDSPSVQLAQIWDSYTALRATAGQGLLSP